MTELAGPAAERLAEAIIARRESLQFETKRVSGKMVGKALETVCAFANTAGGILVLGVEDYDKAKARARLIGIGENRGGGGRAAPQAGDPVPAAR